MSDADDNTKQDPLPRSDPPRIQWCRVTAGGLHPATHAALVLCDLHEREYQRENGNYRARQTRHRKDPTKPDPGTWVDAEASINYTPVDEVWVGLDPTDRALIRAEGMKLEGGAAFLPQFVTGDAFLNTSQEEFQVLAGNLQTLIASAVQVLRAVGREPKP